MAVGALSYVGLVGWPMTGRHVPPASQDSSDRPEATLAAPPCTIQLQDVTDATGIDFQHTDGSSGLRYIVEAMSAGLATFDYDGDGLIDIYFPNGAPLPGLEVTQPPRHALYKNLGGWKFRDVTDVAGVACTAYGLGIGIADYNEDGFPDVYLNNFGDNVLYRNNGDGTFRDETHVANVARGNLVGAGACFLDMDADGDLDLYVGNYIALDCAQHVPVELDGFPSYPKPTSYSAVPDTLYRSNGDGTFTDVSQESGVAAHAGRSMGMVCADYDDDGDTDVFICNDVQENFLFRNDGHGNFEEVAILAGVAVNVEGEILANMAVDCGDYDNDGRLDLFTTNYQRQFPMLLHNLGNGLLEDVFRNARAGTSCFRYVNWGLAFIDFDNDGDLDVYVANGHTEDNIELRDPQGAYRAPNILLAGDGKGGFTDVSAQAGDGMRPVHASRGVAFDDLDNDGDIDGVVLNSREKPTVLRNLLRESQEGDHWLQLTLRGRGSNRDGVGARVTLVHGKRTQTAEVHSGRGYQSHWGSRLHFGLAKDRRAQKLVIRWMDGTSEEFEDLAADQHLLIIQGTGSPFVIPPGERR